MPVKPSCGRSMTPSCVTSWYRASVLASRSLRGRVLRLSTVNASLGQALRSSPLKRPGSNACNRVSLVSLRHGVLAILQRGVELRILPNLWSLRDAVVESTLEFSIIRWRNALPR